MTPMEDRQIVGLFFERSEQAIEALDHKYGTVLQKIAAGILEERMDVEECVNDVYLQVWNNIPPCQSDSLAGYACTAVRNLAVNRYHANHAQKRKGNYGLVLDEMEECIPSRADVETMYEAKELGAAINRFLSTLDPEDRFLFVRRYWYADSVKELAARTKTNANRVSVRLFRLRKKLRAKLAEEGFLA